MIADVDQKIRRAIQAGIERHQAGQLAQAEQIYRQVLAADPANADATHLLGVIASQTGKHEVALQLIAKALQAQPDNTVFLNNYGNSLKENGRIAEAETFYRKAIELKPDYVDAIANLGVALQETGRLQKAAEQFQRALALQPANADACNHLGNCWYALGDWRRAEQSYRKALRHRPGFVEAQVNLGQALRSQGRVAEAEEALRQALAQRPNLAAAHNYLANVLRSAGRLEEAEQSYRRALELDPSDAAAYSNYLFLLNYIPGLSPAAVFAEHRKFARRFCASASKVPHANTPKPGRKLRVGYVSADLRDHPVAFFFEPVLEHHDRRKFEIFCYYNLGRGDEVTRRMRAQADHWRNIAALDDAAFEALVRKDAIDILVDLSGHTGDNRLTAFGRKPAPVQATWLGYLNSTGLDAIDYRISDPYASPLGPLDALHSEKLVRLPDCQWCYRPLRDSPAIVPPPSIASGRATFATFTNPAKIADSMLGLWARVLERVPGSHLIVAGATFSSAPDLLLARFKAAGIDPARLELVGAKPFSEYLAMHGKADVVLDTSPYSGGTTTCHALWMGVPVVTLAADGAAARSAASLLHAVGLDELIATSATQYLDIAVALATDTRRLSALRAGMRKRMAASPLMDEAGFTRNMETALRAMWRVWCVSRQKAR